MKRISTLLLALCMLLIHGAFAQCPGSMTASVATTPASCPSNGSATISTSPTGNPSFTYALTTGPAGTLLNTPQSSNVFSALLPGNYTAEVSCGVTQTSVSFTIADNYTPISNVSADVTLNCGSFAAGGTVTISATGGTAPLQYSIVQTNDPNYADAQSLYNSSNIKPVTAYGTYQVRVKDACNQFYTRTVTVHSTLLPVQFRAPYASWLSCGDTTVTVGINLYNPTLGTYGVLSSYEANGGFKLRIWQQDPGGSCTPTGSVLLDTIITSGNQLSIPLIASKKYYIQTITACGDTTGSCTDLSPFFATYFGVNTAAKGCAGSTTNPPTMQILNFNFTGLIHPITITAKNSAGVTVYTTTIMYNGDTYPRPDLPFDDYTFTATDACSTVKTKNIINPASAGPASYTFWYNANLCGSGTPGTTQNGATTGVLQLSGYQEDEGNVTFTVISGPSNVGVQAIQHYYGQWKWDNLLPGTYVIRVATTCGSKDYTIAVNPNPSDLFTESITAAAVSNCGGGGSVTATVITNHTSQIFYDLVDASTGLAIASNFNGNFGNVAPGSYYVKMTSGDCNGAQYNRNSNTVTLASAAGPAVAKRMGVICEDANGNPLSTGTAYLSIAGAAPFIVEYKLTSSSTWINYSSNASADIAITGLTAESVYDVRVTSCGITNATQITIGQLGPIHMTNTQQPCAGNSYEMDLPQYTGAVYEWKNAAGSIVSTAYNYKIVSYNPSYNGKYVGTVIWGGGCLKRADSIILNSALCGFTVLPVNLSSFTGKAQNCVVTLNWKTTSSSGFSNFVIERSTNGKDYSPIVNISKAETGNYNYTDNSQLQATVYYRLKMLDKDGRFVYSDILTINTRCNSAGTQWSVYPSLVTAGSPVTVKVNASGAIAASIKIVITSTAGQRVDARDITVHTGQNNYSLSLGNVIVQGTYFVSLYDTQGQRIGDVQKLIIIK